MRKILALLLLGVVSMSAYADSGIVGAAGLCSPNQRSFELVPTLETSGWGDIPAPPGARIFAADPEIDGGIGYTYKCKIGSNQIKLVIIVFPPGQGMGEGGGVIIIDKLTVNKQVLLKNAYFNWSVSGEPELISVEIKHNKRGLVERLCYASDISVPKSQWRCEIKQI